MTTDAEQHVRTLLHEAAPEPPRVLRGEELRRAADDAPGDVVPLRRQGSRTQVLSVMLAVAAVVVVALVAVLMNRPDGRRSAPALATPSTSRNSTADSSGPPRCGNDQLVLAEGRLVGSTSTLTISDRSHAGCTLRPLPTIVTIQRGRTISTLPVSSYAPPGPVIVRPQHPVRIIVRVHPVSGCGGTAPSPTSIGMRMGAWVYSAKLTRSGCVGYAIASARVASG